MTKEDDYIIGVDIGGTNMKSVLMRDNKVIDEYVLKTPTDNLEHLWIMLKALIDPLLETAKNNKVKVDKLGLSIAGLYDTKTRKITKCQNIPILDNVDLVSKIKDEFNVEVKIDNDANCFVRGEVFVGSAQNSNNVFGITIGTGIGGGWWFNNDIYLGANNGATEIGPMILEDGQSLEYIYRKLTQHNPFKLADEAYHSDNLAIKMYEELGNYLGFACANIINLLDPELIVLGGGITGSSDLFLSKTKKVAQKFIINPRSKKTKIIKSKLGEKVCAIGAVKLFQDTSL